MKEKTRDVPLLCPCEKALQALPSWRNPACLSWMLPPSCRDGVGGRPAPHLHRDPDQPLLEHWEHAAGPGSLFGEGMALAAGGCDCTLPPEHRLPVVSAATRKEAHWDLPPLWILGFIQQPQDEQDSFLSCIWIAQVGSSRKLEWCKS